LRRSNFTLTAKPSIQPPPGLPGERASALSRFEFRVTRCGWRSR
jgi:hypothetical protein